MALPLEPASLQELSAGPSGDRPSGRGVFLQKCGASASQNSPWSNFGLWISDFGLLTFEIRHSTFEIATRPRPVSARGSRRKARPPAPRKGTGGLVEFRNPECLLPG